MSLIRKKNTMAYDGTFYNMVMNGTVNWMQTKHSSWIKKTHAVELKCAIIAPVVTVTFTSVRRHICLFPSINECRG